MPGIADLIGAAADGVTAGLQGATSVEQARAAADQTRRGAMEALMQTAWTVDETRQSEQRAAAEERVREQQEAQQLSLMRAIENALAERAGVPGWVWLLVIAGGLGAIGLAIWLGLRGK